MDDFLTQNVILETWRLHFGTLEAPFWYPEAPPGDFCAHIGCHWEILGDWVVSFGAFRLQFGVLGRSLGPYCGHLVSFWVPRADKIQPPRHLADIAKTYENC